MKKMLILVSGAALCMLHSIPSHAETAPLRMTIASFPTNIDPNDDFFIDIKIENIGKKPFHIGRYRTLIAENGHYKVHVEDAAGKILNYRTDSRHPEQGPGLSETSLLTLQPHEFFVDRLVLDDLFDLSKPGEYTVEIDRKLLPEWGGWELHSNRITITIPG